jgi:hypothetical protein
MRALTGFAHAGYAALHVRDMLSHGDSDPLQTHSIRATLLLDSGVLCSKHGPRSTTPF